MIYLQLFWTFFKIGLFTIGGGQAMIPMISQEVVEKGWLTLDEVQSFIAISGSTPGPFAVNIATYTGVSVLQSAGVGESILGAICATFGVVLPSLVIITLIALAFSNFIKKPAVQSVFVYVRSTVTGLLIAVFVGFVLSTLFARTRTIRCDRHLPFRITFRAVAYQNQRKNSATYMVDNHIRRDRHAVLRIYSHLISAVRNVKFSLKKHTFELF